MNEETKINLCRKYFKENIIDGTIVNPLNYFKLTEWIQIQDWFTKITKKYKLDEIKFKNLEFHEFNYCDFSDENWAIFYFKDKMENNKTKTLIVHYYQTKNKFIVTLE